GFTQDKGKNSFAEEIFPAEDETLINNIFSQKNSEFDKRLHFQRDKERTLRIRIKNSENFSVSKKYSTPIDISYFKKFGFFLFLKNNSSKQLLLTLLDSRGNEMKKKIDLSDYNNNKWHNIVFDIKTFENYSFNNKVITQIKFDLINEFGIDIFDNDVFIDEIYMEESEPFVGFANKNEFIYEDSKLEFKTKEGFNVFGSPKFRVATIFTTDNFLKEEMRLNKNYILNIDSSFGFKFITMDFNILSLIDIFFRTKVYNPNETFGFKVTKNPDKKLPLIFGFIYDYNRNSILDSAGIIQLNTKNENRRLILNLGFKFDNISLKVDYDIDTQKKDILYNNNKFIVDFKLNFEKINFGLLYNIYNKKRTPQLSGSNSMENFGYIFSEDFTTFFYEGENKYQYLNLKSNFNIIANVDFTNSIEYRDFVIKQTSDFNFFTKYDNKSTIDIKLSYNGETKSFFNTEYVRTLENSYIKDYSSINWGDYFYNFGNNFNYLTPLFFYPPFSGIYRKDGKIIFGFDYRFGNLRDSLKFDINWSIFLTKSFFLPYKFTFSFIESIVNRVFYTSDYTFTFGLYGEGEISTTFFKNLNATYLLNQTINIKSQEKSFKSEIILGLNIYLFNNIDMENSFSYFLTYTEGINKKEFNHEINFKTKFYKDFYKKNYITGDKEGVDITIITEFSSNFYQRLDTLTDMLNNPIKVYLTPEVGYRFNKNLKIQGSTKFGYSMDYSPTLNQFKNNFAFEFYIEGIVSF
ncbi:MAG TPA: hypothetical protein PK771_08900, partial [Spirochaetota bacterium]|nr:hypothetical protein [Spirochaetota bacterium]